MFASIAVQILQKVDYGGRLTALREENRWSRERLALALSVSYDTVRRLERGRTSLTTEYAEAIARVYGLSLIEFWKWMCK
jgi:transcriptional regulator with XRE-family HTH domain